MFFFYKLQMLLLDLAHIWLLRREAMDISVLENMFFVVYFDPMEGIFIFWEISIRGS